MLKRFGILILGLILAIFCGGYPAWGKEGAADKPILTLPILQERLNAANQEAGIAQISLQNLTIDLRADSDRPERLLPEQFYQILSTELSSKKVNLDLSDSVILGTLATRRLGLRSPLYGQSLSPLFNPTELEQIQRDRNRLLQLSQLSRSLRLQASPQNPLQLTVFRGSLILQNTEFVGEGDFSNTFFLSPVYGQGAIFQDYTDWSGSRFSQLANFSNSLFQQRVTFKNCIFFGKSNFNRAHFQQDMSLASSVFADVASFNQANFAQLADFRRVQFQANADFSQTQWHQITLFNKGNFVHSLFLTDAVFEDLLSFREAQFSQPVNLRGSRILSRADFSDVSFSQNAYLNISSLQFDAERAKISGNLGEISRKLLVPVLQGNESLLRNLVQNFREFEQIPDANQIEYLRESLRLQALRKAIFSLNMNTASIQQLRQLGLSQIQANAIALKRQQQEFQTLSDLLMLDEIDLASYIKLRDRAIAIAPQTWSLKLRKGLQVLGLAVLLSLSRYGTSFWLTFGVGLVAIAYFGLLFWLVDRFRRRLPKPIAPTPAEFFWATFSYSFLTLSGLVAIFRTSESPSLTLCCLGIVLLPIPAILVGLLYKQGRYHDLMDESYFVEDGSMRQLRLLIGRLPVIPRFPFFRDRHLPLLMDRRWNLLNYYDLSLNNWLRFGFNDIRLRDRAVPGYISALVWYQWSLGLLYMTLILWTLSRTIPGLNLLIYFK
ncbi:pentapeptide repeat-containing protein [Desertifilum sp. FACHB-1129]|uniref:pentapeptide repeat-containing protein n=1 Tax=unclassified Desertifilum TaxID=2621682 RepID=UPI0016833D68|nr:pentapeptide repeat-containing protein [Desertifilum tharense]MBD2314265.1 pentapeptide repeat-containing protein [Desertifilum sp. FACHB-1129]MBD2320368.1 pentapeptide repeat-containing protein [Desertifilum sp. FACHB-866]MBD2330496.1 pentapeptide repeat-containing protein [Desertifilum sp. FACHB-868]